MGIFVLEIFDCVFKGKLIALAVLPILLGLPLDCVVGQMYKFIIDVGLFIFFKNIFVLLAQLLRVAVILDFLSLVALKSHTGQSGISMFKKMDL